jgi:hypothetical protein
MIGSPEDVGRRVAAFAKETKCSHFVMGMQVPDVDPAKEKNQSMELLATETLPAFRRKPGRAETFQPAHRLTASLS